MSRKADIDDEFFRCFGIDACGAWQGLALAEARVEKHGSDSLVYVYFLETAPWNLLIPILEPRPLFLGVGTNLIVTCARFSIISGTEGRVGLHSLPQAMGFYERLGFENMGEDMDHEGLCYMELSPERALNLIGRPR